MWLVGTAVMTVALIPAVATALRKRLADRLVGLELVAVLASQLLFLYAVGEKRPAFVDVGLTVGILAFGGALVFARFLERWL
ncbi:MAG TPA: monovalent cation/H+ antiporter complex subunit F [Ideonella sp.]|nr:monovalent cation/H+ antiporter complex subunit F [Ideonella sp.]